MSSPNPPTPPAAPPGTPQLSRAPGTSSVDQQISRLYGESLFGPWLDSAQILEAGRRERRRGSWRTRFLVLVIGATLVTTAVWLTRRGLARQAAQSRALVAKDVTAFLADGELERLSQFVAILCPPGSPLLATDPYLDLIVQAEAALYRYHDADPARLARIQPHLSGPDLSPMRLVARFIIASNAERAQLQESLESLREIFPSSPELWSLIANAHEAAPTTDTDDQRRREVAAARASWDRSFALAPLWLPHRYLQSLFEQRQRNGEGLARIVRHMAKVAPDSPWTRLALELPGVAPPPVTTTDRPLPAVAEYHRQLAFVFESLRTGGSPAGRRQALERAFTAVHDGAPFVLDAFTWLTMARADDLASAVTSFEAWPRGSELAQALAGRRPIMAPGQVVSLRAAPAGLGASVNAQAASQPAARPAKAKHDRHGTRNKRNRGKASQRGGRHRP